MYYVVLHVNSEEPLILPGTEERPGDVIYDGIGQGGTAASFHPKVQVQL